MSELRKVRQKLFNFFVDEYGILTLESELYSIIDIAREVIAAETDTVNDHLISWAKKGYAPQLIYDDDGHWAVSFDSFGAVGSAPDVIMDDDLIWADTPIEAVMAKLNGSES